MKLSIKAKQVTDSDDDMSMLDIDDDRDLENEPSNLSVTSKNKIYDELDR